MSPKPAKKSHIKLSFKPKQATKQLLSVLPVRARDIVTKRYGLGGETKPMTLEAIGKKYGITRERVRQIETKAMQKLRQPQRRYLVQDYLDDLN